MRGKDGRARVVRIGHEATRALDRYLRIGPGMDRRGGRSCGWGRATAGPMTANGIYQMIARHEQAGRGGCLDAPVPASLQPHLAGPRRAEGDLMKLNGWSSPQMLRRYGARVRRTYDRTMTDRP